MQAVSEGARSIWDEYRLLGEVFRGPATVAWSAEHVISGRRARLTTVHAPPMSSSVTAEAVSHAFRRAAERAREFTHPDHLPIIGIAEQAGLPVAVTMLPEGGMLSEQLTEQPVPLGEAMKRISQVAHAVSALHGPTSSSQGPVSRRHGYLIPENLWVREDGRVLLADSGIHAAAAHAAFSSGFPISPCPYLPPGDDAYAEANQGADIYALVALLVRLVTGRAPAPGRLTAAVEALPDVLPVSLRAELMAAVATPRSEIAPSARSLAVHLAFDTAWIRAQERSRRERDLLEGEVLGSDGSHCADGLERSGSPVTGESTLGRWARAYPTAGVRGGAAVPATVASGPLVRLAEISQTTARSIGRLLPRWSPVITNRRELEITPLVSSYGVRLGPFADAKMAGTMRARVRGAWPMAAVITDGNGYFVHVTACANRHRAEELVERFRQEGDPAEVNAL